MPLTDTAIKAAKPASKAFKLSDEKGLYLFIHPNGSKYWRFDYRFEAKRQTLAIVVYPDTGLKEARAKRDNARKLIADGTNPAEVSKAEKYTVSEKRREESEALVIAEMIAAGDPLPDSFEAVAREWFARFEPEWSRLYSNKIIRRLEAEIFPFIGQRPIDEITAPELLRTLQRIEERGIHEIAHRAKRSIGQVMRYAVATGRAQYDPTAALKGLLAAPKKRHMAAPTEPKDIAPLLRIMAGYRGSPITRAALTIAPCVFVRIGELRQMQWADIDFESCEWRYTASKTQQDHIVPLARQVIEALRELQPLTGHARYVFTGARTGNPPIFSVGRK